MIASPARSSTRPRPYVNRGVAPRRASQNATPRGIAVAASAKLWIVSASKATLPDSSTTPVWIRAVTMSPPNDHFSAHIPRSLEAMDGSTMPCACP